jgi:phenylalanyl-tRNA synthetase beta chain
LLDVCGAEIGVAGQLHPRLAGRWKLRQPVFVAELLLEPLLEAFERMRGRLRYRPIPKLPAVERDLSLVLDRHISFAQVRAAIEAAGVQALAAVEPRDLYEGSPIPEGKYSLLIRLRFQSSEATLTEAELNDYLSRILASLQQRVGATLRGPQTAS